MKKGMFFTFIALFIVVLIVALVTTRDRYRYRDKSEAISSRIITMNNFVYDLEQDLQRELFIGGYRALLSMNEYVRSIEDYVDDFDAVYTEILVNGTANSTEMVLMTEGDQGAHIKGWLERINEESSKMNVEVDIDFINVTVRQVSPWMIRLSSNVTLDMRDTRGLATWNFTKEYSQDFSIVGFEDPLFIVSTKDKVTSLINRSPFLDFVDPDNRTTNLTVHLLDDYYVNSSAAPSFLQRYSGDLSPSEFGIESMVNIDDVDAQQIEIYSRSVIDYIYFGTGSTTDYCEFESMPIWFRVDEDHLEYYELLQLNYTDC